jgi:hypothetical protein
MTRIGEVGTTLAVTTNDIVLLRSVLRLQVTANFVPSSQILVTRMMEAIYSPETSVVTRATRRNVQEDGILHIGSLLQIVFRSVFKQRVTDIFSIDVLFQCHRLLVRRICRFK